MNADRDRTIVVTGATGLQGGAVARRLLSDGWQVRALTRNPNGEKAQALSVLGAEVVQGDMEQPDTLIPIFERAYGVYSVQNPVLSGIEGEIQQGKNVAEAAKKAGVQHLVYASAGTGKKGTGIPSWESKVSIEEHLKSLGLPYTILRPVAFMELMTEKKFFPAVSTWRIMPELIGSKTNVYWLCTEDLAFIVSKAFAEPERFTAMELNLASDIRSIDECRLLYQQVLGKRPPSFPMPAWVFERFGFVGKDLSLMWRWLREANFHQDTGPTFAVLPEALSVQAWLEKQKG
jgi:uncharacterized protein YbjT (DUF2867 family)